MVYVTLAVLLSTAVGVACDRRFTLAAPAARLMLAAMLYALVPFVSFVNFAHLKLSVGGGIGLAAAYVAIGITGLCVWAVGRWRMRLPRRTLGALIVSVIVVNTGYLGLPMSLALLGSHGLSDAIPYDQLVSGPMFLTFGFGVGAAFGGRGGEPWPARLKAFVVRNPPLLAVIAGALTPPSVVPLSLVRLSHVVVASLLVLGFFVVGVHLSAERRDERAPLLEWPDRRVALAVGGRLLGPVLILAAVSATAVRLPTAYLLQAAMPTGVTSLVVGHAYGLDQRLIATAIVWSTAAVLVIGLLLALA